MFEETLLEPAECSVVWERRSPANGSSKGPAAANTNPLLHLPASECDLSTPFPPPSTEGSSVSVR